MFLRHHDDREDERGRACFSEILLSLSRSLFLVLRGFCVLLSPASFLFAVVIAQEIH